MRFMTLSSCSEGMMIGKSIYGKNNVMLLRRGYPIKGGHIRALANLGYPGIYVDDEASAGVEVTEVVDPSIRVQASEAVSDLFENTKYLKQANTQQMAKGVISSVSEIVDAISNNNEPVINIMSLKTYDEYTFQHSVDVTILSVILGKEMNFTREQLHDLGKSAIFHDIGKMQVPKYILDKPGALTPQEFEEMKKHPELGYIIVKNFLNESETIARGALFHHERFSGEGYPKKISGRQIPLFARIIAVADTYDAIVSNRTYKR
ncbi:MAG: HD-GYP domain-containing protein, partial [Defluviitaleaceae bacterium]|nr:HD-GYP domain-containing protein [Defluviitaleaceae bacterium]